MSPRKYLDHGDNKKVKSGLAINGPRPSPLKLKQESRTIHKHNEPIKRPIIIYTRSPEVIHTKPNDFMALVQKLTGHSSSKDQDQEQEQKLKKTLKQDRYDRNGNDISNDSGVTHEKDEIMKAKSPMFNTPSNSYVGDIPLFTPNTISDYFCSPQRFYRFSDVASSSPNVSTSLSPGSIVELLKGLNS